MIWASLLMAVAAANFGTPEFVVHRVELREYRVPATNAPPVRGSDLPRHAAEAGKGVFDVKTQVATSSNDWGVIACAYKHVENRLDLLVTVTNTSLEEIDGLELTLLKLQWPGKKGGTIDQDRVLAYLMTTGEQAVAVGNWEAARPVHVTVTDDGTLKLVVPKEEWPHHPIVDDVYFSIPGRQVPPRGSDRYHVSVHVGPRETTAAELCKPVLEHFRKERPLTLKWPDRRTIGRVFLANSWTQWKTNPRGYLFGKGQNNNVFTPEGLAEFRMALLAAADAQIKIAKENNAQGVIVWDLEGAEFWHPMTYLGNPHQMSLTSPEMEKYADEYLRKFREAGLRIGLTLRPTEISLGTKPWTRFWHRDTQDPVEHISAKIQYCRNRWGCTLFYLDSNVYGTYKAWDIAATDKRIPWVMPTCVLTEIAKRHPDVLIIPEHENAGYYASTGPYKTQIIDQCTANANATTVWPDAFAVLISEERTVENRWETYLADVLRGDILFTEAFYAPLYNVYVRFLYEEAGYLKTGWPKSLVDRANTAALLPLTQDTDARTRYHAARALGPLKDAKAIPALAAMLTDTNLVVRKSALVALGQSGRITDRLVISNLVAVLRNPDKQTGFLKVFAAETIGTAGEAAVPALLEALPNPQAIRALGLTRTRDAGAHQAIIAILADPKRDYWTRLQAARAAGNAKITSAVDTLVTFLPAGNEDLAEAAIIALGQIGDERAVPALLATWNRKFDSWTRMRIPGALDTTLRQITGKNLSGKDDWRAAFPSP